MSDPYEIITETYKDLNMCELVSWEEYETALERDFAAQEDNYLSEPEDDWMDEDEGEDYED